MRMLMLTASVCVMMTMAGYSQESRTPPGPPEKDSAWSGFRGIRWGTHIRDCEGMVEDGHYGGQGLESLKLYARRNESLSAGDAKLANIDYLFYKDRLCSVMIWTRGRHNWTALRDVVLARYGGGTRQPLNGDRIMPGADGGVVAEHWLWVKSNVEIELVRDQREAVLLMMSYAPIWKTAIAENEKRAREAAARDF